MPKRSITRAAPRATRYGLAQSVLEPPKDSIVAQVAGFGTASTSVFAQAVCVTGATRNAATAPFTLTGWIDDEWRPSGVRCTSRRLC